MKKNLTNYFIVVILFLVFVLAIFSYLNNQSPKFVIINNQKIKIEIADTIALRRQGLSGRQSLDTNQGMLFIFPTKSTQSFWNKDMKFPIDVLWIEDDKVVGIATLPIDSGLETTIISDKMVDKVLELPIGSVIRNNIKPGDEVKNVQKYQANN